MVTPFVIFFGFLIAMGVNRLPKMCKGPAIFSSLLPMIVTPLIGSLVLAWMLEADGIIGIFLQYLADDPDLNIKASLPLTWIMLIVYGIWSSTPFAFVVFYAGLQTVPSEPLEAARIDGANRFEQIIYVVIPYMMPLMVFVALMQLMDNFRVFEPIIGFSADAKATSLSWLIYNDLLGDNKLYGSAAATSMMTILGVAILLTPIIIHTWREFSAKSS